MLRIYNSLTRKKEIFSPQKSGEVKMYTCGVTVYDHCHVGHGRSLYIFEVIRRYLRYLGYQVKFVRNITDVDDKIINKARNIAEKRKVTLEEAFEEVRKIYIDSYYSDLASLGIPPADFEPKATENILEMIEFVQKLLNKGIAYKKGGNVYFRVRKFPTYGKLSGKNIEELFSNVRIEPDPLKEDPLDFTLWKERKPDEPYWSSPFGEGRPGWHIECSVMATKFLGQILDIHGGGKDLIFPHHENEIAQSESFTGRGFARYWIHHGLITVNQEKMAKSLGNFFTIKDVLKKYHPEDLKIFYLSAHYSSPLDFSWEKLDQARSAKERIYAIYDRVRDVSLSPVISMEIREVKEKFEEAMNDDFNMPKALGALFDLSSIIAGVDINNSILGEVKNIVLMAKDILSIFEESYPLNDEFKKYIEEKIQERAKLRKERRFIEADKIRDDLKKKGIILEDLRDGKTFWRIKR